jgi:hypothetical protein
MSHCMAAEKSQEGSCMNWEQMRCYLQVRGLACPSIRHQGAKTRGVLDLPSKHLSSKGNGALLLCPHHYQHLGMDGCTWLSDLPLKVEACDSLGSQKSHL